MIDSWYTLSRGPASLEHVAAQRIWTRPVKMGTCQEESSRQVLERKPRSSWLRKKSTYPENTHEKGNTLASKWTGFSPFHLYQDIWQNLKKKFKYMSLPFLKKMKSWQNLGHLSLKYWWSVRPKSKKTGRNVFFWEKAKLSDSLLVVSSSKCSAVLKFRNIIKWQTVTPCDIKSMVLIRGLEKEMATHSSVLAWRIPWTEESGGLHTVRGVAKSQRWLSH